MHNSREHPSLVRDGRVWIASVAFWTVFGVLSAAQIYVREAPAAGRAPVHSVFNIVYFYWAWALITPLIAGLAVRLMNAWPQRRQLMLLHLPIPAAVVLLQASFYIAFATLDGQVSIAAMPLGIRRAVLGHLAGNILTYIAIASVFSIYRHVERMRDTERERERERARLALRTSELTAALAEAHLDALRAQLQPHFLFNTLNTVAALVAKNDTRAAHRALARLGDLLRAALSSTANQLVPLAEELALARNYTEIAQLRYGDGLRVSEHVSNEALSALVPLFILQPLLENAVQHGIAAAGGAGTLDVSARRDANLLVIQVEDSGPGFMRNMANGTPGIGLANVRDRLAHCFDGDVAVETTNRGERGGVVTLRMPWKPAMGAWLPDLVGEADSVSLGSPAPFAGARE